MEGVAASGEENSRCSAQSRWLGIATTSLLNRHCKGKAKSIPHILQHQTATDAEEIALSEGRVAQIENGNHGPLSPFLGSLVPGNHIATNAFGPVRFQD
jgi:hypothetical protein